MTIIKNEFIACSSCEERLHSICLVIFLFVEFIIFVQEILVGCNSSIVVDD